MSTATLLVLYVAVGSVSIAAYAEGLRTLRIGGDVIVVEVAATPEARAQGLAGRSQLDGSAGMLFVFDADERPCVWMKDTELPLAAAFVTGTGRISEIRELTPRSMSLECSSEPVRYVLELPSGWFNRKNVLPGDGIKGLDD